MERRGDPKPFVCPECRSKVLIWDLGSREVICKDCGLVVAESFLDTGPEWRAFTQTERESRSRVGAPLSFSIYDKGMTTIIGRIDKDAYGKRIPLETRIRMFRLRRQQRMSRVNSGVDRNLAEAMSELDMLTERLHVSSTIKEKAAVTYRKALNMGLVRGRSISEIAAASLYAACREMGTPRTLKEVATYIIKDEKDIAKSYRLLLRVLNLHMPVPRAPSMVPRIASKLSVKERTWHKAMDILRDAERLKATAGKDPKGLAAAALYIASVLNDETITQDMIADAAGVTSVTIRNRYKELKEVLDLDVSRNHLTRKPNRSGLQIQTSPTPYITNLVPSTKANADEALMTA